jgi:xanthosine utilization system XapX-like protein
MVVSPRTKLLVSIAATLAGLGLLLSLFLNKQPANPAEAFVAVLLFIGGAIALWKRGKSGKSEDAENKNVLKNPAPVDRSNESEPDDFLAQFMKKPETEEVAKTETEHLPKKSEADEFLAQFLKK